MEINCLPISVGNRYEDFYVCNLLDTAIDPSPVTLTHDTLPRCPDSRCKSDPVLMSHTMRLQSQDPDTTCVLLVIDTATQVTISE